MSLMLKSSKRKGQMPSYARASKTKKGCKHWLKNSIVRYANTLFKILNLQCINIDDQSSYMPEGVVIFKQQ